MNKLLVELSQTLTDQNHVSTPARELTPFVSFYYENTAGNMGGYNFSRILLPHVGFSLIFNLDEAFTIRSRVNEFQVGRNILLPRNRTYFFPSSSQFFCIHFLFSFLPFTKGKSQVEFQQPLPLQSLLDDTFVKELSNANDFHQRADISNTYFTKLFNSYAKKIDRVRFVLDKLHSSFTRHEYQASNEQVFVASKTLARNFIRFTGASYKDCYRILRLRAFLNSYIDSNRTAKPTYFGFYDYSHFYKEVINVTGYTFAELKNIIKNEPDFLL